MDAPAKKAPLKLPIDAGMAALADELALELGEAVIAVDLRTKDSARHVQMRKRVKSVACLLGLVHRAA
jgi:hypothetical protein